MFYRRFVNIFLAAVYFIMTAAYSVSANIQTGERAPDFNVTSADGDKLDPEILKGRVAVIFYESKDMVEVNRPLKKALNEYYFNLDPQARDKIARVSVIRCSDFFQNVWRKALREHSRTEGITIYGDWDGAMEKDYSMKPDDSNFLIIDKNGIICKYESGVIPELEYPGIIEMIDRLSK